MQCVNSVDIIAVAGAAPDARIPRQLSIVQTILLKSTDPDVIAAASTALSEADGYRLIFCEDDRTAIRRMDEVLVNLFLYDCGDGSRIDESALIHSRLAHTSCARIVVFDPARTPQGFQLANRTAAFVFLFKPLDPPQLGVVAKRALEQAELARRHRILSRELKLSLDEDIFQTTPDGSVQGGYSQFERLVFV